MMTMDDFMEYAAYSRIEPFGDDREDLRAAILPHFVARQFAKKGKRPKFQDFVLSNMIDHGAVKRRQSTDTMQARLKALAAEAKKK